MNEIKSALSFKLLTVAIYAFLTCCRAFPQNIKETGENIKTGNVVVIFKNCPDQNRTSALRFGTNGKLAEYTFYYIDSACSLRHFTPRINGCDTLKIPSFYGYAEIMHRNQGIEKLYYLIKAGDTISFSYGKNKRPKIKSLTSEYNTWLYNIPEHDRRSVRPSGYNLKTVCTSPRYDYMWYVLHNKGGNPELKKKFISICPDLDSLRAVLKKYYFDYYKVLDSLENCGRISAVYADYFKGKHLPAKMRNDTSNITVDFNRLPPPKELNPILSSDSLMHYVFAQELAGASANIIAPGYFNVYKISSRGFKKIISDTTLSKYARATILKTAMHRLISGDGGWNGFNYPAEIINKCNNIYIKFTGDSCFVNKYKSLGSVKDFKSKDLMVESINGTRFRFPDILTHNKGKFIYVDFWASWCAPCVGGMEAAYKLRKELRNKDIVFIYLNIWDTRENWKDAVKRYGISRENGRNYFIINGDSSIFIRGLNLTSIPRMILYDKTGKLINADAPHPGDPMLKKILKQ